MAEKDQDLRSKEEMSAVIQLMNTTLCDMF